MEVPVVKIKEGEPGNESGEKLIKSIVNMVCLNWSIACLNPLSSLNTLHGRFKKEKKNGGCGNLWYITFEGKFPFLNTWRWIYQMMSFNTLLVCCLRHKTGAYFFKCVKFVLCENLSVITCRRFLPVSFVSFSKWWNRLFSVSWVNSLCYWHNALSPPSVHVWCFFFFFL